MSNTRTRQLSWTAVLAVPLATALLVPAVASSASRPAPDEAALGLQTAEKTPLPVGAAKTTGGPGSNPYISLLPDPRTADYASWRRAMDARGAERARAAAARIGVEADPLLVDEREPDLLRGANDTRRTAQRIRPFGTGRGERPAAEISGTLAPSPPPTTIGPFAEDDGSIPLANPTGLGATRPAVSASAVIGDGPHGSAGDATGDFDFYAVRDASAGQELVVDVDTPSSDLDSVAVVYDAQGTPLAANDDSAPGDTDSLVSFTLPSAGDYFVLLAGFGSSTPQDPFDSGSGGGAGSEGAYRVNIALDAPSDTDVYSVVLAAGDVVGASVTGGATSLTVHGPDGREDVGSRQDLTGIYPPQSPLPGGGNAVLAHVADRAGLHTLTVRGEVSTTAADYRVTLEAYRPGLESEARGATQTVFLDFDGARLNTAPLQGPGVRTLSPFDNFIGRWDLSARDRNALIDQIVATTRENLDRDFGGPGPRVRVLNSRDHRDCFGAAGVSRVIVGGSIAESGIPTIGIAQSIDPGNFAREETALLLLDVLSAPAGSTPASLNTYLRPESDRVRFIGTAIGNTVAHEAGHYLGSFHVDQFNDVLNIMDQGGNFPLLFGVGPDGIGGTADDPDVDFGHDHYNPNEGFTGTENTRANTRWALSGLTR